MNIEFNFGQLFNKLKPKKNSDFIFYLFLLVYIAFLIVLSNKLEIWEDEAFSLNTTSTNLYKAIHLSYFFESQPPVYFVILTLWRKLNDGIIFARLFSILFTLLSAFFLHKLGKMIFEKIYTKWVIVLFLLNPYTVWASTEIRLYSWLIFLSIFTIYLFYLIYFHDRSKLKLYFIIISLLGIYTQYYFVFLIISLSVLLLYSKGWRVFFNFCMLSMVLLVLFLPNLLIIPEQYAMSIHINVHKARTLLEWIGCLSFSPLQFWFSIYETQIGLKARWFVFLVFILLFLLLMGKFYSENKNQKTKDFKTIQELFIPILTLLFFFLIIFLNSNLFYTHRYMTIIFPFYCLLYSTLGILNEKLRNGIYIGFVAYYIFIFTNIYTPPYLKLNDNKSAADYVQRIEHKNEPILFRHTSILLTFKHYYKGSNTLVSIPERKFDFNYYQNEIKDTSELRQLINKNTVNCKSFLLVSMYDGHICKDYLTNAKMDSYLKQNYQVSQDTVINGKERLYYLRIRRLCKN